MSGNDNRIRLDQTPVDFNVAESTGERSDTYPLPNTQARYDQMRSYLIGLLSNQSSTLPPFERRTGTTWYRRAPTPALGQVPDPDLMMVHTGDATGGQWDNLSDHIGVADTNNNVVTLSEIVSTILGSLQYVGPRVIWSGVFTNAVNSANLLINIPSKYAGYVAIPNMRPLVYINGLLIDPRITFIQPNETAYISFNQSVSVKSGQTYTVIFEYVTDIEQDTIVS